MVKSDHKRQQKLARKQAKDRQRKQEQAQRQQMTASLAGQMQLASRGRIVACLRTAEMDLQGMGQVWLAREYRGQIALMFMLVDTYCLGVKDAGGRLMSPSEFEKFRDDHEARMDWQELDPAEARGLVEGAIRYARDIGLEPHPDYRRVAPLWGDIQAASIEGLYEFGLNGKPCYIEGPFDDPARQAIIRKALSRSDHARIQEAKKEADTVLQP